MNREVVDVLPEWSDSDLEPLISLDNSPVIGPMDITGSSRQRFFGMWSPQPPATISADDRGDLSATSSHNRVQEECSRDMPAEGRVFDVSPDLSGIRMRPNEPALELPVHTQTASPVYKGVTDPFFGVPIAFAQCNKVLGLEAPMTLPIYTMPKEAVLVPGPSGIPTIVASGASPNSVAWSSAVDIIRDISREGPFEAGTSPMDTDDGPLIFTALPGCPYRFTSYTGTSMADENTTYGLQLHHPRFLEYIGAPESARLLHHSPSFWINRLGGECAMAAAVNLQRDAGLMMSNLQVLGQFVTALHRLSSEMMSIGVNHVVFPTDDVADLSMTPRAQRAAKYMTAMGLWRPPSGPGAPGRYQPRPVHLACDAVVVFQTESRHGSSYA